MPEHYTPITRVPDIPYSTDEIWHFARHNLHILQNGRAQDTLRHPDAVEHFARIIERQPPAFQVISVGSACPNVMTHPDDMEKDHMGLFMSDTVAGIGTNPVYWGGMFETRLRTSKNDAIVPDVTFRHEQGHRTDHIVACRHIGEGRLPLYSPYLSLMPEWYEAAARQISIAPGLHERLSDGMLYKGMRRLTDHLSLPSYQGNSPAQRRHHVALESFAEMTAHYATLYHDYDRDEARVDAELTKTYPVLWPVYRDKMLPLIEQEAVTLSNEIRSVKKGILYSMASIASLRAEPFEPDTATQALRRIELEGGLPKLTRHDRDTYRRLNTHRYPHDAYREITGRVDTLRRKLVPQADGCAISEWEDTLDQMPHAPYHALASQGIDIEPEIGLLRQEAVLLRAFTRKMRPLQDSDLTPGQGDDAWIMEDFDRLAYASGRNTGSIEGIRRICRDTHTAEDYRHYAHAYGIERDLLHDGRRPSEEEARTARQYMYQNLLSGTFGTYREAMEACARAERDFIAEKTNALPGNASTETITMARKQARQSFRETLRAFVEKRGFTALFTPLNRIGPDRTRVKPLASTETLHHRIDGRSGL